MQALVEEGNALFVSDNIPGALAKFEEALKVDERNVDARLAKANCLIKLGKFDQAVDDTSLVLEVDPSNVKALFRKGFVSLSLDDCPALLCFH
jgi:peptidyl-prolyl isomerase D